jgi:tetratricopeptide (TPR) repeat protein
MQNRLRTAVALSFALATSVPASHAFTRAETKVEQRIDAEERNEAVKEQLLRTDGLMREHAAKVTAGCKTPMEIAKAIYDDIRGYGAGGKLTKAGIIANAQQTFYLKRGYCSARSYLFISLFNERMKALGMKAEARMCEIYRNTALRAIPHVAVAVIEGDHTVIFDPTLNKITDRRAQPIVANVLDDNGILSNHFVNLAAVADGEKDHAKAESYARIAVKIEPNSAVAHCILAGYLMQNGKLGEARNEAEAAVRSAPAWPNGYSMLRDVLSKLGLNEEERIVQKKMHKVLPESVWDINSNLREMGYKTE